MTYDQAKTKFATIKPSWKNNYKRLFIASEAAEKDKREDCHAKQVFIGLMSNVSEIETPINLIRPGSL